jgi:uncharacterized protein with FMN-binding domain
MSGPKSNQTATKLVVAALIIGVFLVYSLVHGQTSPTALVPRSTSSTPPASGGTPGAAYKDGTYTGSIADAQWGYVQVQVVIQGGRITNVQFLQYPNDRSRSIEINQYADPELVQEAIQAQSAQVDVISGATDTSIAFMQSLSDALSQARGS